MKRFLGAAMLTALIGTDALALGQITFGIQIGRPPARIVEVRPTRPGRNYVWVDGFWYPGFNRRGYAWNRGYWAVPPGAGSYWIAPRYSNNRYYYGYWSDRRDRDYDYNRNRRNDRYNRR
jgi:hypothetical protein